MNNNFETKSIYEVYSPNLKTDYPKYYATSEQSLGISYYIDENSAIFTDYSFDFGTSKGYTSNFFGKNHKTTNRTMITLGYKHSFGN